MEPTSSLDTISFLPRAIRIECPDGLASNARITCAETGKLVTIPITRIDISIIAAEEIYADVRTFLTDENGRVRRGGPMRVRCFLGPKAQPRSSTYSRLLARVIRAWNPATK